MNVVWILFALGSGLVLLGLSLWWTPIDEMWKRQEQHLLARGLAPQRNAAWEKNAYAGAWVAISSGVFLLLISFGLWRAVASIPPQMSGVTIFGHQLTEAEWNECGRDHESCALFVHMKQQESQK